MKTIKAIQLLQTLAIVALLLSNYAQHQSIGILDKRISALSRAVTNTTPPIVKSDKETPTQQNKTLVWRQKKDRLYPLGVWQLICLEKGTVEYELRTVDGQEWAGFCGGADLDHGKGFTSLAAAQAAANMDALQKGFAIQSP